MTIGYFYIPLAASLLSLQLFSFLSDRTSKSNKVARRDNNIDAAYFWESSRSNFVSASSRVLQFFHVREHAYH
jgi:hypothetical protein